MADRTRPVPEDLEAMSTTEIARVAAELDDVEIVRSEPRWPVAGTRAERRATASVVLWFAVAAVSGVAFVVAFLLWPWTYRAPGEDGHLAYSLYTPVIGAAFGLSVLALGIGVVRYVKEFFPDEVAVQQRHDGRSDDVARRAVTAQLVDAGTRGAGGLGRRRLIIRGLGLAGGAIGLATGVAAVAPFVRDPWKGGDRAALWVTPWASVEGEQVYLRYDTGIPEEVALVRPEDQAPGSMMTVFPFRESERDDPEALLAALRAADAPVMLIRLPAEVPLVLREGQEDFHWGDYIAYSKLCTHLGCPASLYESRTQRLLCPCHQSQFLANEYGRPVFGPAARSLPQLPITVDEDGFFVAVSDFVEPVGPAFWEMRAE